MRKFKHTKTGTIGELRDDGYLHLDVSKTIDHEIIDFKFIEDSNDWEEILEASLNSYRIISFREKSTDKIFKNYNGKCCREDLGKFVPQIHYTLLELLQNENFEIILIIRISDNQEIAIGDCVSFYQDDLLLSGGITYIEYDGKALYFGIDNNIYRQEALTLTIIKKLVLLTEDNVSIYEDEDFFYVDSDCKIIPSRAYKSLWTQGGKNCFSTIEKAQDFVVDNKKIFSVKDLCILYVKGRPFGSNKITMTIDLDSLKKSSRSLCGLSKFNFDN